MTTNSNLVEVPVSQLSGLIPEELLQDLIEADQLTNTTLVTHKTGLDEAQAILEEILEQYGEVQDQLEVWGYDDNTGEVLETLLNRSIELIQSLI